MEIPTTDYHFLVFVNSIWQMANKTSSCPVEVKSEKFENFSLLLVNNKSWVGWGERRFATIGTDRWVAGWKNSRRVGTGWRSRQRRFLPVACRLPFNHPRSTGRVGWVGRQTGAPRCWLVGRPTVVGAAIHPAGPPSGVEAPPQEEKLGCKPGTRTHTRIRLHSFSFSRHTSTHTYTHSERVDKQQLRCTRNIRQRFSTCACQWVRMRWNVVACCPVNVLSSVPAEWNCYNPKTAWSVSSSVLKIFNWYHSNRAFKSNHFRMDDVFFQIQNGCVWYRNGIDNDVPRFTNRTTKRNRRRRKTNGETRREREKWCDGWRGRRGCTQRERGEQKGMMIKAGWVVGESHTRAGWRKNEFPSRWCPSPRIDRGSQLGTGHQLTPRLMMTSFSLLISRFLLKGEVESGGWVGENPTDTLFRHTDFFFFYRINARNFYHLFFHITTVRWWIAVDIKEIQEFQSRGEVSPRAHHAPSYNSRTLFPPFRRGPLLF